MTKGKKGTDKTMKITWLGQAGLMIETGDEIILVDPYLSDSVEKIEPHNYRRVPVDERFLKVRPTVILLTHDHLDHTDPETLVHYLGADTRVTVLAPETAWSHVLERFGGIGNNYVKVMRHTEWTERSVHFRAVMADHSDPTAVGYLIGAEGKTLYVTGDTLYNPDIFSDLPEKIDAVFLPVNGKGNNMNMTDGARFCERIGATAVPYHCGLFDSMDLHDFPYPDKVVPEWYREIPLF